MFSIGERSGLQAGQFSTRPLLLRSHVVIAAVCGFALSCWNKHHLEGSICCSKTSPFQNLQAAHTVCTYTPTCHQRCLLLNWMLITCWKVKSSHLYLYSAFNNTNWSIEEEYWLETNTRRSLSSLAQRTQHPLFPTRMSHLDSSGHRTLFHLETIHFKWALAHRTRRRFWFMFTYGFLFAWKSFSWHLQMAQWIVFTDSCFWKYSWAHLLMSMTDSCRWVTQCQLRARRPRASNKGLLPCPLHTEISPVSHNLLMILCTVDDDICKAFTIWFWGRLFLKYSTIFLQTLSLIGEHLSIFTSERLCLSKTSLLCYRPDVN